MSVPFSDRIEITRDDSNLRKSLWVIPAAVAAALTYLIMFALPADRTIDNVGEWAFRISPVIFAVIAAAMFPPKTGRNLILLIVLILGFMGVLDTLNTVRIFDFAGATDQSSAFPRLYQMLTFMDAFFIVSVTFAYRLGGVKTSKVLRLGFAGILVLTSGLNDLTFYYSNTSWADGHRPARLYWASHIRVFVGGDPTPATAIVFCAVNLLLAAAIIVIPWFLRSRRLAAAAAGTTVVAATNPATGATPAADPSVVGPGQVAQAAASAEIGQ